MIFTRKTARRSQSVTSSPRRVASHFVPVDQNTRSRNSSSRVTPSRYGKSTTKSSPGKTSSFVDVKFEEDKENIEAMLAMESRLELEKRVAAVIRPCDSQEGEVCYVSNCQDKLRCRFCRGDPSESAVTHVASK